MIKYNKIKVPENEVASIQCDICKREYTNDVASFDIQEFSHIYGRGGYNSAIGDEIKYEIDICSGCLRRHLGKWLRFPEEDGEFKKRFMEVK